MALTFEILFVVFLLNNVAGAEYFAGDETREEDDKVTNLPGQPPVNFSHYAGYVKLRPEEEKALFYWFFEAQESPSDKPLVLWLSGGMRGPHHFCFFILIHFQVIQIFCILIFELCSFLRAKPYKLTFSCIVAK